VVQHVALSDLADARHGQRAASTAHPAAEVARRRGRRDEVDGEARGALPMAAPVRPVQDRLALRDRGVALAERAPRDVAALDDQLRLDAEELRPPEHDVGDLPWFERADPARDAVRAG